MYVSLVTQALHGMEGLLLVNSLHELPYHQWYTLDALDLLLCPHQLALQTALLVLDVLFLKVNVPATISHLLVKPGTNTTYSSCR